MFKHALLFLLFTFPTITHAAETFSLQDFAKFGIRAEAVKLVDPRLEKLEYTEDRYYLEVRLGRLTLDQYENLMAHYGNASRVAYDPRKEYELLDFLHPAIQATANKALEPEGYDTESLYALDFDQLGEETQSIVWPLEKNGVSFLANCWNTTTQILRLMHPDLARQEMNYSIYWPGRWSINDELKSSELSRLVGEEEIRAGDALLISATGDLADSEGMIQHTALVLSDSLVFEKTDSSENDPFRISFREDVLKKYRGIFEPEFMVTEYRRYNELGRKTFVLPRPGLLRDEISPKDLPLLEKAIPDILDLRLVAGCETGLGGGCDLGYSQMEDFKVITDPKTGRGILEGNRKLLGRFIPLKAQ